MQQTLPDHLAKHVGGLDRSDHGSSVLLHVVRRVGFLIGELQQVTAAVGHDGWHSLEVQPELQQTAIPRHRPLVVPMPRLGHRRQPSLQTTRAGFSPRVRQVAMVASSLTQHGLDPRTSRCRPCNDGILSE